MGDARQYLEREGGIIYRALLGKDPAAVLVERYAEANLRKFGEEKSMELRRLVERGVDIEALEFAWRLRDPLNLLTGKVHVMIYLAEARPENFPLFFNTRKRRLIACMVIPWHFLRSVYKGIKGIILLKRGPYA